MIELKTYRHNIEIHQTTDEIEIYQRLAQTLIAKKINNCKWVRTIKRENLFNGFIRITVVQTENIKDIYIIKG